MPNISYVLAVALAVVYAVGIPFTFVIREVSGRWMNRSGSERS